MAVIVKVVLSDIVEKIDKSYDYVYPFEDTAPAGKRVLVPFGKGNTPRKGLILESFVSSETEHLKSVLSVLDEQPVVDESRIRFLNFLKEQYFITHYTALNCLLPSGLDYKIKRAYFYIGGDYDEKFEPLMAFLKRQKKALPLEKFPIELQDLAQKAVRQGLLAEQVSGVRNLGDLSEKTISLNVSALEAEEYATGLSARMQGQKDLIYLLLDYPSISAKEAVYMTGCGASAIKTLEKNKIIRIYLQPISRTPYQNMKRVSDFSEISLNPEQEQVYREIHDVLGLGRSTHLIFGVTGSGKTHIYMKLMSDVIAAGKSVLFMVPEISLTPQTLEKFYGRFGDMVAVIHSGLSVGQRLDEWKKIKNLSQSVVVGTRSAVFAPIQNLGLIIMDEEHEASYKSESAPKFHARDIARFLSSEYDVPLILGSATPSMETFRSAENGKTVLHSLTKRYNKAPLPQVEMVDMREEYRDGNMSFLSASLKEQLMQTLENKEQAILFLNRRGAHTTVACPSCGFVLKCPNCGISMTYHSANDRCICHFCSHSIKAPDTCPQCGGEHIKMTGMGTQLVETKLKELFPEAGILRMDMDTVGSYISYQTMLEQFADGKYDILLGTQMVAKGLNFPNVTLVGVLQADMSLYIEDFRAGERTFSLLTQVCGRSGRSEKPGKAVIQSFSPDHEVLNFAKNQDFLSFYDYEIKFRKAINYPPFCDIAMFTVTAVSLNKAFAAANQLFGIMEKRSVTDASDIPIRLLRPSAPRIAHVNQKYRVQLMVKCRNSAKLRALARECMSQVTEEFGVSISLDINPLSFN